MTRYRENLVAGHYTAPSPDPSTLSITELRAEAKRLGLDATGTKKQLTARLKATQA
jgi:SAP domain